MAKRVLVIGIGGSGKLILTILKERLIESYGIVPDTVSLLSLDTDDLRKIDGFANVHLNPAIDEMQRQPEFHQVVSRQGVTMDTIFGDMAINRTSMSHMDWLEKVIRNLTPF